MNLHSAWIFILTVHDTSVLISSVCMLWLALKKAWQERRKAAGILKFKNQAADIRFALTRLLATQERITTIPISLWAPTPKSLWKSLLVTSMSRYVTATIYA